jgi:hypothetical protein
MSEDTGTAAIDDSGEGGVITALRKQVRELQKNVQQNDPKAIEAEVRARVKREAEAAKLMDKAGYPKLVDTFLEAVPEGELGDRVAGDFLDGLGLTAQEPADNDEGHSEGDVEEQDNSGGSVDPADVAKIAGAGSDLASKTAQSGAPDPLAAINAAETNDDLIELARAGGYLQT